MGWVPTVWARTGRWQLGCLWMGLGGNTVTDRPELKTAGNPVGITGCQG